MMSWSSILRVWGLVSATIAAGLFHTSIYSDGYVFVRLFAGLFTTVLLLSAVVALHISMLPCSASHTLSSLLLSYYIHQKCVFKVRPALAKMTKIWQDPRSAQESLLQGLITRDGDTVYGKDNHLSGIGSLEDLQKKHPVTVYSHYQDYIRRLADGEEDAFVGEKPLRFGITSGTTGTGKLIPVVPSQPQMTDLVIFKSWHCHGYGEFGAPSPVQKHLVLYCKPKVTVTKSGLSVTPLIYFPEESRFICDVLFTSPFDGFRIMSDYESTYIHMLFGIRDKHIGTFTAPFLSQVYRAFKLLEGNWEIMLDDLTDGRLGDHLNIDEDIRKALNAKLKPMPERAAELRSEFTQGFEGIMGRMWPNIKFINSIDIAGFQKKLLRYSKGTPVYTSGYSCTESTLALNVNPRLKQYVLLPDEVVYEFIPEENCCEEQPKTLLIDEVEKGKKYELVLTLKSGFYRYRFGDVIEVVGHHENCPVVEVCYRTGELLNLRSEKIDVGVACSAIEQTVSNWSDANLVDWTCADSPLLHEGSKGDGCDMFYMVFVEVDAASNNNVTEEEKEMFDGILRKLHGIYDNYRRVGTIAEPRLHIVQPGSFKELEDLIIGTSTTSINQFKMPRKLRTRKQLDFMLTREVSGCVPNLNY
ncbi:probable indole-3-acetic acid-amido synthetase GH3.9 [Asterias rubens]|uniref:probable indole-3-acetic acid-amido synthetase GH3.9 n=1 Tax=Asterias rubens TaxID=7604 RepID=UPI0014557562|nr:probable indole-3-acetic acid-amido synthetase GH3.9 [Asterias rubens]